MSDLNLNDENEMLLQLLSGILKASAMLLRNDAMLETYKSIQVHQHLIDEHIEQRKELSAGLTKGAIVFSKYLKDDGRYGWGDHSPDLLIIERISKAEVNSIDLIELLEMRAKIVAKIICINSFEVLNQNKNGIYEEGA